MYKDIFDNIPCPQDYAGTQDEFFLALTKAIEEQKPLEGYLKKKTIPSDINVKI
jgi:hypothetical protein